MTSKTSSNTKLSSLLNQVDNEINVDNLAWNKATFQKLVTSNLPTKTILYYAIVVGFQRLENSLYEPYWDDTADALNDLTQFVCTQPVNNDTDNYLYEAKCQLLLYSATALIKMSTIRRRSIQDARMACAAIFLLLLERTKPYEPPSTAHDYYSCVQSMYHRYLKRILITVPWLSTLSEAQWNDIQTNYERYITILVNQLYSASTLEEKINNFIDKNLFGNNLDDDNASNGFVFVRQYPTFNEQIIAKYNDLMNICLASTLKQFKNNLARKLIFYIWTLCCMIESKRVSLGMISSSIVCEHFSHQLIDFEQRPIQFESLNERDVIVFLLLCAQQNVHLNVGDSVLHPYLLFSLAHLCTEQQKNWWQTAMKNSPSNEFIDHLATIRLCEERLSQHPPKIVILETALILFQSAHKLYEQYAKGAASSYEQYALRYLQIAKASQQNPGLSDSLNKSMTSGSKQEKLFFFYSQKTMNINSTYIEQLIEKCEKFAQQCDELKLLTEPEPPRTSSPTEEQQKDINISAVLSPLAVQETDQRNLEISDSTLFATPPTHKTTRDVDIQTFIPSPSPSPPPVPTPPIISETIIEEAIEPSEPPLPAYVDTIFSHMNSVNEWINNFCLNHEVMQNDVNTIRDRLEKINRLTSQMMFSNMKISPSETNENPGGFYSSRHP